MTLRRLPAGVPIDVSDDPPTIVEELGAGAAVLFPSGERAAILDLAGSVNRRPSAGDHAGPPDRTHGRYLLSTEQTAELVAELCAIGYTLDAAAFETALRAAIEERSDA